VRPRMHCTSTLHLPAVQPAVAAAMNSGWRRRARVRGGPAWWGVPLRLPGLFDCGGSMVSPGPLSCSSRLATTHPPGGEQRLCGKQVAGHPAACCGGHCSSDVGGDRAWPPSHPPPHTRRAPAPLDTLPQLAGCRLMPGRKQAADTACLCALACLDLDEARSPALAAAPAGQGSEFVGADAPAIIRRRCTSMIAIRQELLLQTRAHMDHADCSSPGQQARSQARSAHQPSGCQTPGRTRGRLPARTPPAPPLAADMPCQQQRCPLASQHCRHRSLCHGCR